MTQTLAWPDDLPDFDEPGTTITRHSYGGASAIIVMLFLLALALLVTGLMVADRNRYYHYGTASVPFVYSPYARELEELFAKFRTEPEDYFAEDDVTPASEKAELKEAIEWHFRILDRNDAYRLELFLYRYESHPYAERKGYAREARQALARLRHLEDEAAEHRRRSEQQAIPWDMGVKPPKSAD